MSAMITISTPTALHILADSAAVDCRDNRVVEFVDKVRTRDRCAFAIRGPQCMIEPLERIIFALGTDVDELRGMAPGWLIVHAMPLLDEVGALGMPSDMDLVVAGWSEKRGRPAAWFMTTDPERHGLDVAAWQPVDLDGVALLPDFDDRAAFMAGLPRDGDTIDPHRVGFELMKRQRAAILATGIAGVSVGGSCELVTIAEAGITRTTLGTWPDAIGEPIRAAA